MRITDVRVCQPVAANSPPDWRTALGQTLVEIDTDDGLTGYGVGGGGAAGMHVVRAVLRDLLVGREVEPVEAHWQRMYDATLPFGRKGIAIMALSGVDLALWDLRGKAAGQPVAALLGGRERFRNPVSEGNRVSANAGEPLGPLIPGPSPPQSRGRGESRNFEEAIPVYTTVWDAVDPQTAAAPQAVKLHVHVHRTDDGPGARTRRVAEIVRRVERARDAIGPERALMVDAWMEWDVEITLAVAERIAPLRIDWIEEPLPADDTAGYAELCRLSLVPIAGGEHEFTARGFQELIERQLHHVLQPDVCWTGGMTELVKIYRLVREANAAAGRSVFRVVPHRGAEVWGLHALAALDPHPLAESGRPWMTWVHGQPAITDGHIRLTDAPGFGIEIDRSTPLVG